MLLVELTINGTLHRISNEELPLTHLWKQYVDNGFTSPSYRTRTDTGGFCELTFGSLPLLPDLFESDWPPPAQCRCRIYYTTLLEASKTELFDGYAYLKSFNRESVTYDLYIHNPSIPLLKETTDYNGDTVPIPYAFGAVSHINPLQLPDDENNYPVYCLSGLSTNTAKFGTNIYNANKGVGNNVVGDAFITCTGHGFETGDNVTIEGFGNYDGTYTITAYSNDIVDLNTNFVNQLYHLSITFTRTSGSGALSLFIGDAPNGLNPISISGGFGTMFYAQGGGYFKISKDASWAGTVTQVILYKTSGNNIIGTPDLKYPERWTAGTGWTVSESTGIAATAGTASDLIYSFTVLENYTGQLFAPGQTVLYDDGYPIPENLEEIDTETFTLNANPVGELTVSGVNPDITNLTDLIEWACHEDRLCMSYDTTLARSPSPVVNYWADSQTLVTDFLSDVCAFNTHLFYITKDKTDITGKTINIRSTSYTWTVSGSGTGEYYLRNAADENPYKAKPDTVHINSTAVSEGSIGSLSAGTWGYGDNDSLGYETIYIRLLDDSDPDLVAPEFEYVQAIYHDTLYLVAMETSNGTRTLTEFDFFSATYEALSPIKSLESTWQMRDAVEDTSGVYVKDSELSEKILNRSYGNEESFEPYDYTKSTIKTRLQTLLSYLNKSIVTVTMPMYANALPVPGEKFTIPDTSLVVDTISEMFVRSIQYDFDNDEFVVSGDGIISEDT